jgi:Ubiquitin-activating enzyme E1 FCCH domain
MTYGTLPNIRSLFRELSGTGTSYQVTDSMIDDLINSFYLFDFPAQFRSLKLKDNYVFYTIQGVDTYAFDSENYTTVEMPCKVEKNLVQLFQDPSSFYGYWNFNNGAGSQFQQQLATGNGTNGFIGGTITAITNATNAQVTSTNHGLVTGNVVTITGVVGMTQVNGLNFTITFVDANNFLLNVDSTGYGVYVSGGAWTSSIYYGTVSNIPFLRSVNTDITNNPNKISIVPNVLITANTTTGTMNVYDDGNGSLIGDVLNSNGVINYQTGIIQNLTFSQAIPDGNPIYIQYIPIVLNRPEGILFFQNQFTLRPVPDRGYTIELVAYRRPSQALAKANNFYPELTEWWETIAYGAAKKWYEKKLDPEGIAMMDKGLSERYALNDTRTYAQLGKQRCSTIFAQQSSGYGNNFGGFGTGWGQ